MTGTQTSSTVDVLLADASAATGGLTDFGDPSFRPALETLWAALLDEADLSVMGRQLLEQKVRQQLVDRLLVEDWFTRHPEIADENVDDPLVIVGLPRTGSTTLQRLLSADPRLRWMAWWESIYPVPFPGESLADPEVRRRQARQDVATMVTAMPDLMAIHPMDADEADEEVMLMEHSFLSAFNAYADIPSYTAWLDGNDQRPAYDYLRRMLQFLQWQQRHRGVDGERWLLKSPHHLLRVEILLDVFPGARIVQTHRDPAETIPSIASFVQVLRQIYADHPDPRRCGAEWSELMHRAVTHAMTVRAQYPDRFLDVDFHDIVERPLDVVAQIQGFLGWPPSSAATAAMTERLASGHDHDGPRHHYDAADYGLSPEQIRHDFADYRQTYLSAAR